MSKADLLDRKWLRKLKWGMKHVENSNLNKIDVLNYNYACSKSNYNGLKKSHSNLVKRLFPWLSVEGISADVVEKMTKEWQEYFGDLNDPTVQEKINETVKALMEN